MRPGDPRPSAIRRSTTVVAVCALVTVFAVGALIYALTIFGLGVSAFAGLRRSNSILVRL